MDKLSSTPKQQQLKFSPADRALAFRAGERIPSAVVPMPQTREEELHMRKPLPKRKAPVRSTFVTAPVVYLNGEHIDQHDFIAGYAEAQRRGLCSLTITEINRLLAGA